MWYIPLDLPGEDRTVNTLAECRQRCVDIPECFYFNNFADGGCHVVGKNGTLIRQPNNPAVASGAVRCEDEEGIIFIEYPNPIPALIPAQP